jgi:hypothetical protein
MAIQVQGALECLRFWRVGHVAYRLALPLDNSCGLSNSYVSEVPL